MRPAGLLHNVGLLLTKHAALHWPIGSILWMRLPI